MEAHIIQEAYSFDIESQFSQLWHLLQQEATAVKSEGIPGMNALRHF